MRKDYLTLTTAQKFLSDNFEIQMTIDALRKQVQRGRLRTKQYTQNGPHLLTRGDLNEWVKVYIAGQR